jgi:uncharacterized Zn finger protein
MGLCTVCPACGSEDTRVTIPSLAGAYCECRGCGHLWHDQPNLPSGLAPEPRRKTDRRKT